MASTYTTNLRLTKQADGENPNSWGAILNDGVISLVDDAYCWVHYCINRQCCNSNSDRKLRDQVISLALLFLSLKGTVGGIHDTLIFLIPNNSKTYVVRNSVSYNDSTDAIVLKGSW